MTRCEDDFCKRYCNRATRRACDHTKCTGTAQYAIYHLAHTLDDAQKAIAEHLRGDQR